MMIVHIENVFRSGFITRSKSKPPYEYTIGMLRRDSGVYSLGIDGCVGSMGKKG